MSDPVKQFRLLWNNIEAIVIFLFFVTFPFNIRKVFLTKYSYLNGEFNEYMTLSFSWSDSLILLLIIIYIIKRLISQFAKSGSNKQFQYNKFNVTSSVIRRITKISRETFLLYILLSWMAISIFWSPFKEIAIYRLFIILTLLIFFWISLSLIKKGLIKADLLFLGLILGGIFQSLLGISQFIFNQSLELRFLGESILNPELPGVAKIIVSGVKHIRAYGTFSHPNILAGFLVLQIILITIILLDRQKGKTVHSQKISHETILSYLPDIFFFAALIINFCCFVLTFSRSAFLSLVIIGSILLFIKVGRSRYYYWLLLGTAFFAFLFLGLAVVSRHYSNFLLSTQSLQERSLYSQVSREIISEHPIKGIGLGQFVFSEYSKYPTWEGWKYQPVHNTYLLLASELGLSGLILFSLYILTYLINCCNIIHRSVRLTQNLLCFIIISFLIIFFFDHYFWDLKPGIIIFTIPFLLNYINNETEK